MATARKKLSPTMLDTMKTAKPGVEVMPLPAAPVRSTRRGQAADGRVGQTLRLSRDAWTALKVLAANEGVTAHDLLIEGVNMLFSARNKPPIA